ncbi:uncharacterized protein UDID_20732 [Ustilago sp. UG-2017a]|nr:uncharacterized protein UDID_20732 [Ustilago sp. UG-2017a]
MFVIESFIHRSGSSKRVARRGHTRIHAGHFRKLCILTSTSTPTSRKERSGHARAGQSCVETKLTLKKIKKSDFGKCKKPNASQATGYRCQSGAGNRWNGRR